MDLAFLKPFIPTVLLQARKRYYKKRAQEKLRQEIARKSKAAKLSLPEFQQMLRDLGIRSGDCLLVHSGIGTFNSVEGGAPAMLKSMELAVGPEGHLLLPAFPDWAKTMRERVPFNQQTTASTMGTLAELFRAKPGVQRSLHPTHSVCASGPQAAWLVAGHETSPYAFGKNSPFYKACLLNGKILAIGLTLNSITPFHVYEDLLVPDLWLPVYDPEPVEFEMIPAQGAPFRYRGYFHSNYSQKRDCERLRDSLMKSGVMQSIKTDYSEIFILDGRGFVLQCLNQLLNQWSIYGKISITPARRQRVQALMVEIQRELDAGRPRSQ